MRNWRDADREIARNALLEARRPGRYKYDDTAFTHFVEQMAGFFCTAEEITENDVIEADCPWKPPKRHGIPLAGDYKQDKSSLFLDKLHNTDDEQCDEITSFFVRRSVYFAFFGKLDRGLWRERQSEHERRERLAREEQERIAEQDVLERERFQ